MAVSIKQNAKGRALLAALDKAFAEAKRLGASRKAIVFTESRRTQEYLLRVLADSPYSEGIVLFNGTNSDEKSRKLYADWLKRHEGTDRITGSKTADMRSALVDYFREQGQIIIATEAGAEGINLQFCALVVNYDLPWNPQRIEQRIGRCHRYGQKHDVVVVNFLNQKNEADQRVFQLLSEKFSLFEGVFGASDEVGSDRTLLVLCTAFRGKPDRYPNLTVKKIPKQVLSRCEWSHDDYSLKVENLPKAPPSPGQQEMEL